MVHTCLKGEKGISSLVKGKRGISSLVKDEGEKGDFRRQYKCTPKRMIL